MRTASISLNFHTTEYKSKAK